MFLAGAVNGCILHGQGPRVVIMVKGVHPCQLPPHATHLSLWSLSSKPWCIKHRGSPPLSSPRPSGWPNNQPCLPPLLYSGLPPTLTSSCGSPSCQPSPPDGHARPSSHTLPSTHISTACGHRLAQDAATLSTPDSAHPTVRTLCPFFTQQRPTRPIPQHLTKSCLCSVPCPTGGRCHLALATVALLFLACSPSLGP